MIETNLAFFYGSEFQNIFLRESILEEKINVKYSIYVDYPKCQYCSSGIWIEKEPYKFFVCNCRLKFQRCMRRSKYFNWNYFITLTSPFKTLKQLKDHVRKTRILKKFKHYIAVTELGDKGKYHLHCLVLTKYLDVVQLNQQWNYIVDLKKVYNPQKVGYYVSKYTQKSKKYISGRSIYYSRSTKVMEDLHKLI